MNKDRNESLVLENYENEFSYKKGNICHNYQADASE